ncbi:MAG: SIS domain-containing protein [Cellvibrio sp.]|jgi:D-sedoheptulose 7-phosphate isomerase|nr:SIS domain-containing protein [Cellvibrio sp.]
MEQRIINIFHESIEACMNAGENLPPLLVSASQSIVNALLNDKKIMCCGNGISSAQAQILTSCLINRFEQERPGLPALHLGADVTTQTAISRDYGLNDIYAKQLRSLGQAGDILVLISDQGKSSNLLQSISAAHDKDIQVIALTGADGGDITTLLDHRDIELRAPSNSMPRIHEIHLLSIFCLCDLIDQQLFGNQTD